MSNKVSIAPSFKRKARHEFIDFIIIALYLAFFFCALSTYAMLLLKKYEIGYLNYTLAVINALIIAKVILVGEMAHLGRGVENRPLYQSILFKALFFGLLVFAFHLIEEFVKRLIHGEASGTVLHGIHFDDLLSRSLVVFCAFLPLFGFREIRRVLGEDKLYALLLKPEPRSIQALRPEPENITTA